jgi:hypothetical protein
MREDNLISISGHFIIFLTYKFSSKVQRLKFSLSIFALILNPKDIFQFLNILF